MKDTAKLWEKLENNEFSHHGADPYEAAWLQGAHAGLLDDLAKNIASEVKLRVTLRKRAAEDASTEPLVKLLNATLLEKARIQNLIQKTFKWDECLTLPVLSEKSIR